MAVNPCGRRDSQAARRNPSPAPAVPTFGGRPGTRGESGRSGIRTPGNKKKHNVVRLGTETLFAIADQLRRMYDADLRTKPSDELERLMQRIERGEDIS